MVAVDFPQIKVTIGDGGVREMFKRSPAIMAYQLRDVFGQFAGSHRREVLGGLAGGYRRLAKASLFYRVKPDKGEILQFRSSKSRQIRLDDIKLRIFATSKVTLIHETGGTITPKKGAAMAIPVRGTRAGEVSGFRRKAPTPAELTAEGVTLVRKGNALFQIGKTKTGRDRFQLRFLLTGAVQIKPALGIIRTWERLAPDRKRRLDKAVAKAAEQMGQAAKQVKDDRVSAVLGGLDAALRRASG